MNLSTTNRKSFNQIVSTLLSVNVNQSDKKKVYSFKNTILAAMLFFMSSASWGQTTVTYTQQTSQYDQSLTTTGSGGIYNNGITEVGMWMAGDNSGNSFAGNVLWKNFRIGSATSNSQRSLQVGDEFTITVSTKGFYYGTIGLSLNSGSLPSATWANRTSNSRVRVQQDGSNFGGGNPGSWYYSASTSGSFSITPTGSYVDYVIKVKLISPDRCNISVNGTWAYDVALGGTTGASITHYSIYMSDDRAGIFSNPNRGDSYWKQTTQVQNTGSLNFGASTNSFTESNILFNGLDANSTSANALNNGLSKDGAGNLTLSGANTYAGNTTINNGYIYLGAENTGSVGSITNSPIGRGTLAITGGALSSNGTTARTILNPVTLGGNFSLGNSVNNGVLTFSATGTLTGNRQVTILSPVTYSGKLTGAFSLTKLGTGTLTLSDATNDYSGGTVIQGGTVSVSNAGHLGNTGGAITIGNSSTSTTLDVTSTLSRTALNVIDGSSAGVINVASGQTFTLTNLNTPSGTSTATKIGKSGPGSLILSGSGTYTGQIQIGDGSVILSNNSGLGTNNTTGNRGVDLGLNVADVSQANNVSLLATNGITVPQSIYVAPNTSSATRTIGLSGSGSATFSNEIFLGGTLTADAGSGTLTLSGKLTSTGGGVTVSGGTVVLSNGTSDYTAANTVNSGGTLSLGATGSGSNSPLGTTAGITSIASGGALDLAGFTLATAEPLTLNGTGISSGGALLNSGANATYSGLLTLGASSSIIGGTGTINVSNLGTISGSGFGLTLGGAQGGTLASILGTGAGTLTKQGAGTWTLSGANAFTGATTVSAGTLLVNGSTNASSSVSVASGSILGGNGTVNGPVALSGTIAPGSAASTVGTLTTGAFTFNTSTQYNFDISNVTGTAGTNWDLLTSSNAITISATSGSPAVINLTGNPTGFSSSGSYTWKIAGGTSIGTFAANKFSITTTSFTPSFTGTFSITNTSNDINLVYTPLAGLPTLSTPSVTVTSNTAATLGATVTSDGGVSLTARGTAYKTTAGVAATDNPLAEGGTTVSAFTHSRTSLMPQTLYYYIGYATNSSGTGLSAESSFRTFSSPPTIQASGLSATAASATQLNLSLTTAAIFPSSGATKSGYFLIYNNGGAPSYTVTNGAAPSITTGTQVSITDGTAPAAPTFSSSVTGLSAATSYTFHLVPYTWDGTNDASYNYLTTSFATATATTLATAPSAQPTSIVFSGVTSSSITASWTAASGSPAGYIVLYGTALPNTDPVAGTTYTAGNSLGNATVAYVGSGVSAGAINSLTANTTYNFKIYSYNGSGATINYLATSPLSSSQLTLNDIATADFRSAGTGPANWNTAASWQYNSTGSTYITATQIPGASNNVTIQSGHTITMDVSPTFSAGKTITVNGILTAGTNTISGAGNFTISAGTFNTANTSGISGTIQTSGTNTFTSGTISFNAGSAQNFGSVTALSGMDITTSGSSTNVTLNSNPTVKSLIIGANTTFTCSDNSARALTISKSTSGSSTTLANSGTWSNGIGGSTVTFSGAPSSGDPIHAVTGTIAFQNIIINKTGGSSNVGVDFNTSGTSLAASGKLTIGNGGFVSTNIPTNFYTANGNSTLEFSNSGGYTVGGSDVTWPSSNSPASINITLGTVTLNSARTASGNLNISGGGLTLGANLTINGDWTRANSATFTPSTNTVTLSGSTAQTVDVSGGSTMYNLIVNNSAGVNFSTGGLTINDGGSLTLTAGTVSFASNYNLTVGSTSGGTCTMSRNAGGLSFGTGTIVPTAANIDLIYNNAADITTGAEFSATNTKVRNLTISSNSTYKVTLNNANSVSGTLTISSGAKLADGGYTLTTLGASIVHNGTHTGAGKIKLARVAGDQTITGTGTFQNLENAITTSGNMVVGANFNIAGDFTNSSQGVRGSGNFITFTGTGNFVNNAAMFGEFGNNTLSLVFDGNTTLSGSTGYLDAKNYTINVGKVLDCGTTGLNTNSTSPAKGIITINGSLKTANTAGLWNGLDNTTTIRYSSNNFQTLTIGSNSTIEYNASVAQTVSSVSGIFGGYGNLTTSGSGAKSLVSNLAIAGTFTNNSNLSIGAHTLTLNGAVSGSGTLIGSSSSNLSIGGSGTFGTLSFDQTNDGITNVINSLTLNRSGVTATLGNKLVITNVFTPTAGTLATGDFLTLRSDVTGTARVATGSSSGGYVTGKVTVERYIPAKRAWRFITAPLIGGSSNSIFSNWQNNGSSVANYGVELWSPTGTTAPSSSNTGMALGGGTSIRAYTGNAWSSLTNTNNSNLFDGTTNNSYSVFVTGPFTTNSNGNIYNGSAVTTLSATGTLIQGTHTKSLGTASGSNQYYLVGNPYASPINPASIDLTGSNIASTFYMWDPILNGTNNAGQYIGYNQPSNEYNVITGAYSNSPSTQIQSGQAFFVRASAAGATSITFQESIKSSGSTNGIFRTSSSTPQTLRSTLKKGIGDIMTNLDGAVAIIYDGANAGIDANDAPKLSNSSENISLRRANSNYMFEERPTISTNDTLFLRVWNTQQTTYTLELVGKNLTTTPGLTAELKDRYTNASIPLSLVDTNNYSFAVDANAASSGDRFMVVFKANTTLPVQFTNINAYQKGATVELDWKVATEQNMKQYVVEKSTDAVNFTSIATQTANNIDNSSYSAIDNTPNTGNNYYRVLSIANDGSKAYSNVALVKIGGKQSSISVYPNPIVGNTMNLQMQNIAKGDYAVQMINESGRVVYQTNVQHAGGSGAQSIKLPSAMSSGNYVMKAVDEKGVVFTQKVLVSYK